MKCDHCGKDPGTKETGVWKGFKDADTDQHVCWKCQARHYRGKFKDPDLKGLYSEFPVMIAPAQLQLRFAR